MNATLPRLAFATFLLGLGFRCLLMGAAGYRWAGLGMFLVCCVAAHAVYGQRPNPQPLWLRCAVAAASGWVGFWAADLGLRAMVG